MRVFRTILGMLLLTIGLPALLAGGGLWALMQHRDPGGAFSGQMRGLAVPGYALVVPDVDRLLRDDAPFARVGSTRLRLSAITVSGPAFIGLAPARDVDRYLSDVPYTRVDAVDIGTGALPITTSRVLGRTRPAGMPGQQAFWTMAGQGQLNWAPGELTGGPYSLVVMSPAARPVSKVASAAEVWPSWLNSSTWGLLTLGTLLVMASVIVLAWPGRRREVVYVVEPSQVPDLMQAIGAPLPLSGPLAGGGRQGGAHRPRTLADSRPSRPPALPQFSWPPRSAELPPGGSASSAPASSPAPASAPVALADAPASAPVALADAPANAPVALGAAPAAEAAPSVARAVPAGAVTPAPGQPLNLLGHTPALAGLHPGPLPTGRNDRRRSSAPTDLPEFRATAVGAWVAATAPERARQTEARAAARLAEAAARKSVSASTPPTQPGTRETKQALPIAGPRKRSGSEKRTGETTPADLAAQPASADAAVAQPGKPEGGAAVQAERLASADAAAVQPGKSKGGAAAQAEKPASADAPAVQQGEAKDDPATAVQAAASKPLPANPSVAAASAQAAALKSAPTNASVAVRAGKSAAQSAKFGPAGSSVDEASGKSAPPAASGSPAANGNESGSGKAALEPGREVEAGAPARQGSGEGRPAAGDSPSGAVVPPTSSKPSPRPQAANEPSVAVSRIALHTGPAATDWTATGLTRLGSGRIGSPRPQQPNPATTPRPTAGPAEPSTASGRQAASAAQPSAASPQPAAVPGRSTDAAEKPAPVTAQPPKSTGAKAEPAKSAGAKAEPANSTGAKAEPANSTGAKTQPPAQAGQQTKPGQVTTHTGSAASAAGQPPAWPPVSSAGTAKKDAALSAGPASGGTAAVRAGAGSSGKGQAPAAVQAGSSGEDSAERPGGAGSEEPETPRRPIVPFPSRPAGEAGQGTGTAGPVSAGEKRPIEPGRASLHAVESGRPPAGNPAPNDEATQPAGMTAPATQTGQPRASMHAVERDGPARTVPGQGSPGDTERAGKGRKQTGQADHPLTRAHNRIAGKTSRPNPAGRRAPAAWIKAAESVAARAAQVADEPAQTPAAAKPADAPVAMKPADARAVVKPPAEPAPMATPEALRAARGSLPRPKAPTSEVPPRVTKENGTRKDEAPVERPSGRALSYREEAAELLAGNNERRRRRTVAGRPAERERPKGEPGSK